MSNRAIAAQKRARGSKKKSNPKRKRAATKAPTRRKTTSMARGKKRSRRRRGRRGGAKLSTNEVKDLMIGGAIYGFITEPDAEDSELRTTVVSTLNKVPEIGNRDISNGLALWAIDKYVYSNKHVRSTAKAALTVGAVRFGRRGFKLGGGEADSLRGWDDAVDVTEEGEVVSGIYE